MGNWLEEWIHLSYMYYTSYYTHHIIHLYTYLSIYLSINQSIYLSTYVRTYVWDGCMHTYPHIAHSPIDIMKDNEKNWLRPSRLYPFAKSAHIRWSEPGNAWKCHEAWWPWLVTQECRPAIWMRRKRAPCRYAWWGATADLSSWILRVRHKKGWCWL